MTGVVVIAVLAGVGALGVLSGLRSAAPSLDTVWSTWQQPAGLHEPVVAAPRAGDRVGAALVQRVEAGPWATSHRVHQLRSSLIVTGSEPVRFATQLVGTAALCVFGPVLAWLVLSIGGFAIGLGSAVLLSLAAVPVGIILCVVALDRRAAERRRHFRVVLGSFVDLVVLSLAGGVGIDGALHSAAQITPDWAAQRLARALAAARDTGAAPWDALAAVGDELDVPELVELARTVQLAGTEGARIRQSLTARGASLRRHEQAEAESAANAMTERLFFPGALLLLGFLLFIGFPAVHRILGGF